MASKPVINTLPSQHLPSSAFLPLQGPRDANSGLSCPPSYCFYISQVWGCCLRPQIRCGDADEAREIDWINAYSFTPLAGEGQAEEIWLYSTEKGEA